MSGRSLVAHACATVKRDDDDVHLSPWRPPLTVDMARASWMSKAEAAIKALKDVDGASIQAEEDEIREIHVLTASSRPAKQIVRDVQTLLLTRFNRAIDHRVVSVARVRSADDTARHDIDGASHANEAPVAPTPSASVASVPPPAAAPALAEDRIRYGSANLYVSGARAEAQVELRWKGIVRMGSASGWNTRDGAHKLIASATIGAVQEFLEQDVALTLHGLDIVRIGRRDVVVIGLELLAHREQKNLVGCCTMEEDAQQAIVLATLAALNRVIGGLPTKEPTEYILRPTST